LEPKTTVFGSFLFDFYLIFAVFSPLLVFRWFDAALFSHFFARKPRETLFG